MKLHSIVIPVYNEATGIESLFARMRGIVDGITARTGDACELILVNDGSSDGSDALLDRIHEADPRFKVIHFSRNFGHQVAISAGIEAARGDTVTCLDADLQDPPEVIFEFLQKWREGYEVVYGSRKSRPGETWAKLITARVFYRLIRGITRLDMPVDAGDFRLIDRKVADAFISLPERHRYVRGLMSWVGFKQIGVPYDRQPRRFGETHYPFHKMFKLAFDGISSFSFLPLRVATWAGFATGAAAFVGIAYTLYLRFFTDRTVQGWTSILLATLLIGGVQLLSLGIIGEYLGRMFDEVRRRPLYLVTRSRGFENARQLSRFDQAS